MSTAHWSIASKRKPNSLIWPRSTAFTIERETEDA